METVFVKPWDELKSSFTEDNRKLGGTRITVPNRTSISSNAAAYDKSDVDPVAGTFVSKDAYWTKVYQHTSAEVHGIDISQAGNGGNPSISSLITDAVAMEMDQLWQVIYNAVYTQIKADIDSASTYSDAALNRTTYPTLASTEESTDTPITLALLRSHSNAVRLNKACGPKNRYTYAMETKVYERFEPLASALHTWNVNSDTSDKNLGYQVVGTWEGQKVISPQGMTTGDTFYFRKEDVMIHKHRDLEIVQVPSGRDSAKFVIRVGINGYCIRPGFAGKMTSKD
jgi:hypothetical protein